MNDYIPNPEAMRPLLARAATGAPLSEDEAEKAFTVIMSGQATPAQIGAFLLALRVRGETVDETQIPRLPAGVDPTVRELFDHGNLGWV